MVPNKKKTIYGTTRHSCVNIPQQHMTRRKYTYLEVAKPLFLKS